MADCSSEAGPTVLVVVEVKTPWLLLLLAAKAVAAAWDAGQP